MKLLPCCVKPRRYSHELQPFTTELVGKTITRIGVSETDQAYLAIETTEGAAYYATEGDCCSESWWADITGVDALIGGTVAKTEGVDLPRPDDDRGRQEVDDAYGYHITTNKGQADIVFRNSSNGYYGGSCYFVSEIPDNIEWLSDDWSA